MHLRRSRENSGGRVEGGSDRPAWQSALLMSPGVRGHRRHVLRLLIDHYVDDAGWTSVSTRELAREAGITAPTVRRVLDDLFDLGLIAISSSVTSGGALRERIIMLPSHPCAAVAGVGMAAEGGQG